MDARRINSEQASQHNLTPRERRQVDGVVSAIPDLTPRQIDALVDTLRRIRRRESDPS